MVATSEANLTPNEGQMSTETGLHPFEVSAQLYLSNGWGPLLLPTGQKTPPPSGYTGESGKRVRQEDVNRWLEQNPRGNVGLRLPLNVIAIDVDCYDGKKGAETLTDLERGYGELPPTWSSTSREDGSRQYFYRVTPGTRLPGALGAGVEVLQNHHRYAVVWPSVHPATGRTYTWYTPDGTAAEPGVVPSVGDLTDLPNEWTEVKGLRTSYGNDHRYGERFTDSTVDALLANGIDQDGNQDDDLSQLVFHLVRRGLSDAMVKVMWDAAVYRTDFREVPGKPYGFSDVDFQRHLEGARRKLGNGLTTEQVNWAHEHVTEGEVNALREGNEGEEDPVGNRPALPHPGCPAKVARRLSRLWRHTDGESKLVHWKGGWHAWNGTHWCAISEQSLRAKLYGLLERSIYVTYEDGRPVPNDWNPTSASVNNLLDAMRGLHHLDDEVEDGTWTMEEKKGKGIRTLVPVRNGLLDYVTGTLHQHTPRFFCHYSLPFDHVPGATSQRWLGFLDSVWAGDQGSQALLQEIFGYVLSGRIDLEKMVFIVGPRRSGKGTIATTLTNLLGAKNVAGPTLNSFTTEFGLSTLLGKPLAIVGDARSSRSTDIHLVTERLLSITGRDQIDINRKYVDPWSGVMPTRIMMMGNALLNFKDASGAITGRMLVLETSVSYFGREDKSLKTDLAQEAELAGILNWAIEGMRRLEVQGEFSEPEASAKIREEMNEKANPMGTFIQEECVVGGSELHVISTDLFKAWLAWNRKGDDSKSAETLFGGDLKTALAAQGVTLRRERRSVDGVRRYVYLGIALREPLPDFAR